MITIPPLAMLTDLANATGATLTVYSTTDLLLGTITLASPIGTLTQDATHHILTFGGSTPDTAADASGTASYGRITASNGLVRCIFDITVTGGGGGFTMPSTTIYTGGSLSLTGAVLKAAI